MESSHTTPEHITASYSRSDWTQAVFRPGVLVVSLLPVLAGLIFPLAVGEASLKSYAFHSAASYVLLSLLIWLFCSWSVVTFGLVDTPAIAMRRVASAFVWNVCGLAAWTPTRNYMKVDDRVSMILFCLGVMCFIAYGATCLTWSTPSPRFRRVPDATPSAMLQPLETLPATWIWLLLVFLCGLWHLTFSAITRHNLWLTCTSDLGIMDQTLWNTAHGRLLTFSIHGYQEFRPVHGRLELMYLPISLLYWIYSDPRAALLAQAFFVSLGCVPVFLLARKILNSERLGLLFAVFYFLHPAIQGVCLGSLHGNTLAIPFLLYAFYAVEADDRRGFLISSGLALACREDVGFVLALVGLFAFWKNGFRSGLWVCGASAGWILMVYFLLPKALHPILCGPPHKAVQHEMFGHLQSGMVGMLAQMLRTPGVFVRELFSWENAFYLFQLVAPLAFLPLLCPSLLLTIAPPLTLHLVSGWVLMKNLQTQYPATFLPSLFVASICGVAYLGGRGGFPSIASGEPGGQQPRRLVSGLVFFLLVSGMFFQKTFGVPEVATSIWDHRHTEAMQQTVQLIPKDASVSASQHLGPRLTQRRNYYAIENPDKAQFIIEDSQELLLWSRLSKKPRISLMDPYSFPVMDRNEYGALRNLDGVVTFQLGRSRAAGLRTLFCANRQSTQSLMDVGESLSLVDVHLTQKKSATGGFVQVDLFWKLRHPVKAYPRYRFICQTQDRIHAWVRQPTSRRLPLDDWPRTAAIHDRFYVRLDKADPRGTYRFYLDRVEPGAHEPGALARLKASMRPIGKVAITGES